MELLICSNFKDCPRKNECPHSVPHEERDDCHEADCFGKEVNCIPYNEKEN